jgi:hypothetical protein
MFGKYHVFATVSAATRIWTNTPVTMLVRRSVT